MTSRNTSARADVPLLGALLRLARQELVNAVDAELAAAGFADVTQAQWAVCQQLAGDEAGLRLTELAAFAGISKPSMSALVDGLVASGYVERVPHPHDQRAQLVRFTGKGWKFAGAAERAVKRVETAWAARIGREDVETLRRVLRAIVASRPAAPDEELAPARRSPQRVVRRRA